MNSTNQLLPNNLTEKLNTLSTSLKSLIPISNEKQGVYSELSQNTQLITYTLMATALVGIFVYHYLKEPEKLT